MKTSSKAIIAFIICCIVCCVVMGVVDYFNIIPGLPNIFTGDVKSIDTGNSDSDTAGKTADIITSNPTTDPVWQLMDFNISDSATLSSAQMTLSQCQSTCAANAACLGFARYKTANVGDVATCNFKSSMSKNLASRGNTTWQTYMSNSASAQASYAPSTMTWATFSNTYLTAGHDISSQTLGIDDCQKLCQSTANCYGVTTDSANNCWMKNDVTLGPVPSGAKSASGWSTRYITESAWLY